MRETISVARLIFSCSQGVHRHLGTGYHRERRPAVDMVNDLLPQHEESVFVGMFAFMEMDRRDFKGFVPLRADLFFRDTFAVISDMTHQHMYMEQLILLHTFTNSPLILSSRGDIPNGSNIYQASCATCIQRVLMSSSYRHGFR